MKPKTVLRALPRGGWAGVGLMVAGLIGASLLAAPTHASGDAQTLRVALHADIASINPGVNRDANADMVLAHVVEGLVAYGEDLKIKPVLAESWQVKDDGRVYEFKLRPNVHFQNGAVLTADNVVWNFKRYLNPKTNFQCANRYNGKIGPAMQDVQALDPLTVRFTFSAPAPNFPMTMATLQCTPWILHPDSVKADGSFAAPIGTGPYAFSGMMPGRQLDLKRFEGYDALPGARDGYAGNKTAGIPVLRFMTVPDASTRSNGLLSGDLDVVDGIEPTTIATLRGQGIPVQVQQTPGWLVMQVQSTAPALQDVRMRQAIAHALSLPDLAEASGEGLYTANPSVLAPQSPYYDARSKAWPAYDPAATRKLLAQAGYKGQPITLLVANRQERVQVATIVQAMLAASGINVELKVRDWASQLDLYGRGQYELAIFGYSARLDPLLMYESLIGDKKVEPTRQWDSPEAAALLKQVAMEPDLAKRRDLFNQMHALMARDIPIIGLFNLPVVTALRPAVQGYQGWPAGTHRFWGVTKTQP